MPPLRHEARPSSHSTVTAASPAPPLGAGGERHDGDSPQVERADGPRTLMQRSAKPRQRPKPLWLGRPCFVRMARRSGWL